MFNNKRRAATTVTLMLIAVSVLTLAFSSPVRAAVLQFIGSYNGVEIAIDPETDSLVISGDTSAVAVQESDELFITNAAGDEAVAVFKPDTRNVAVTELLARNPGLSVPSSLPAGYALDAEAILFEHNGRSGTMLSWHNEAGERITFYRGLQPADEVGTVNMSYVVTADLQGNSHAQLTWESADGYFSQIIASDETLTEESLRQMAE